MISNTFLNWPHMGKYTFAWMGEAESLHEEDGELASEDTLSSRMLPKFLEWLTKLVGSYENQGLCLLFSTR